MREALTSIKGGLRREALVISIAAGVSVGFIQDTLGADTRVIRAMPNTPAMVGAGATAFAKSESCTADDAKTARAIFEAIGIAEEVPERLLDAVTALSGARRCGAWIAGGRGGGARGPDVIWRRQVAARIRRGGRHVTRTRDVERRNHRGGVGGI